MGPWGKREASGQSGRVRLQTQGGAWRSKWRDTTYRGEGTLWSRDPQLQAKGELVSWERKRKDSQGWGTEGQMGPDGRQWRSRLGRFVRFPLHTEAHGRGRPHLPVGRRKTKGEEGPDFPGQLQSRPQPWPSCLLGERKLVFLSCPAVASLGQH